MCINFYCVLVGWCSIEHEGSGFYIKIFFSLKEKKLISPPPSIQPSSTTASPVELKKIKADMQNNEHAHAGALNRTRQAN